MIREAARPGGGAFRSLQVAACAGAGVLLALLLPGIPWERWPELLFFAGLSVVAFRLRVRYAGNYVGLEAAALVPGHPPARLPGRRDARLRRRGRRSRSSWRAPGA